MSFLLSASGARGKVWSASTIDERRWFDVVSDKKVSVTVQEQVEDKKPKIVVNEITLTPTTTKNQIVEKKIVEKKVVDNKVTEKPKETNKVGMSKSEFIKMYFNR